MKIAIVEDKKTHTDALVEFINRYGKEEKSTFNVYTFSDGLKFLEAYKTGFDIVFMDINMPFIDGMETAKRLREIDRYTCLIFITEHASYAISGYEVKAFDFIVKPVEYDKFRIKLAKAVEAVSKNDLGKICIKNKDVVRMIKVADICYIESVKHKIIYHLTEEDIETWDALDQIEQKLPPQGFARCGKSFLVNLSGVVSVNGNEVTLFNGTVLPISRLKKKEFIESLTNYTLN